jgi:hypothetical protein
MMKLTSVLPTVLCAAGLLGGCAYRPYATDLAPLGEAQQVQGMTVKDDGTVTFYQGRLEISLRPVSDDELNRQFATESKGGAHSTNPYTYGDSKLGQTRQTPRRFTVFMLNVKNYEFPKVRIGGAVAMVAQNGRKYYALSMEQFEVYYRAYAVGYRGIDHFEYQNRRDLLSRTRYPDYQVVFSGQEAGGFILFEPLADDVTDVTVTVGDVITRFDYTDTPVETIDAAFRFKRDIGRMFPDGSVQVSGG